MPARPVVLLLTLAAALAYAQDEDEGDVLTAHDSRGNIATVYNQFDGQTHSMQVTRLTAQGYVVWSYQHADSYYEKAYASAMDSASNLFIAGVRNANRLKTFLVMKYADNGYLAWENVDNRSNCTATSLAVDRQGGVIVAGVCRAGTAYPARVLKYSNDGQYLWAREYDGGGRNYLRGLQVDYAGNVSVTVETVFGNYRDGSYATRTVVYSPDGHQIEVR